MRRRVLPFLFVFLAAFVGSLAAFEKVVDIRELDPARDPATWPWEKLKAALDARENQPLPIFPARLINLAQHEVAAEEGGPTGAIVVRGIDQRDPAAVHEIVDYLDGGEESIGKRAFAKARLLWQKARLIKLKLFLSAQTGKPYGRITAADYAAVADKQRLRWVVQDVFEPLSLVVVTEELTFGSGYACGPISTFQLLTPEVAGDHATSAIEGIALAADGRFVTRRTDNVLLLEGVDMLPLRQLIESDGLGEVLGHEILHGIHADLIPDPAGVSNGKSMRGHLAHVVTDSRTALAEGLAETFQAIIGEEWPELYRGFEASAGIREMLARQDPVRRNKYVQAGYQKYVRTKRTGRIKNGAQMQASEGLVAGVLYRMLREAKTPDPFATFVTAMVRHQPRTFTDLATALIREAPTAARAGLTKTYLYATHFATVSAPLRRLYEETQVALLAFKRAKNAGDEAAAARAKAAAQETRGRHNQMVRAVLPDLLSGRIPLDQAVGPEIWLDGFTGPSAGDATAVYRYQLNAATPAELAHLGLSEEGRAGVLRVREAEGYVASLGQLKRFVPAADFAKLTRWAELHRSGDLVQAIATMGIGTGD